jgi:hypothetical protein
MTPHEIEGALVLDEMSEAFVSPDILVGIGFLRVTLQMSNYDINRLTNDHLSS